MKLSIPTVSGVGNENQRLTVMSKDGKEIGFVQWNLMGRDKGLRCGAYAKFPGTKSCCFLGPYMSEEDAFKAVIRKYEEDPSWCKKVQDKRKKSLQLSRAKKGKTANDKLRPLSLVSYGKEQNLALRCRKSLKKVFDLAQKQQQKLFEVGLEEKEVIFARGYLTAWNDLMKELPEELSS